MARQKNRAGLNSIDMKTVGLALKERDIKVTNLVLHSNPASDIRAIADGLKYNRVVTSLNIANLKRISAKSISAIKELLKLNKVLKILKIDRKWCGTLKSVWTE